MRQTTDLKMPPNSKLAARDVEALEQWVRAGAVWPEGDIASQKNEEHKRRDSVVSLMLPDHEELRGALQLWLKADALTLKDGSPVHIWPDRSGRGHDFSATAGIRETGTGTPPVFVEHGRVNGRAAVRFETGNGMATSPDHRVDITGDAAATIFLVGQWQPEKSDPPYDNVLMIGNPAASSDPNRPLAFYLELDRRAASLDFAGGWNHDAMLGRGSNRLMYDAGPDDRRHAVLLRRTSIEFGYRPRNVGNKRRPGCAASQRYRCFDRKRNGLERKHPRRLLRGHRLQPSAH